MEGWEPGAVFLMEGNHIWKVRVLRKRGWILRIEFNHNSDQWQEEKELNHSALLTEKAPDEWDFVVGTVPVSWVSLLQEAPGNRKVAHVKVRGVLKHSVEIRRRQDSGEMRSGRRWGS